MAKKISGRAASKPRSFWHKHYHQWQHSGLSKADYCRDHGLSSGTFYGWCHTFTKSEATATPPSFGVAPLELIPVKLETHAGVAETDTISVSCATLTMTLPANLSRESIIDWLGALAAVHAQR